MMNFMMPYVIPRYIASSSLKYQLFNVFLFNFYFKAYTSDTNSFFSAKRTISPLSTRPSTLTNISEAYQKDQLDVNFNLLSSQSSASSSNQNSPIKSDFNRQPSIISTNMNEKIDILVMVVHGGTRFNL